MKQYVLVGAFEKDLFQRNNWVLFDELEFVLVEVLHVTVGLIVYEVPIMDHHSIFSSSGISSSATACAALN